VLAFERASKAVLEWLEKDPGRKAETLLIVMADHETGGFAINGPSGRLVNLGEVIEPAWTSKGHTGVDTVLWAQGPGSEKLGRAAIENTEVFRVMAGVIGAR
jgi:alkaline phosphatase